MSLAQSALVLFSGGIDSTVLLYYVVKGSAYSRVEAILFDYGQQNRIELEYAQATIRDLSIPHKIVKVDLTQFGGSSLTAEDGNSTVIVPGRNSIFLSLATAYAQVRGLKDIYFGAILEDYSNFLDCREDFCRKMGLALISGYNIGGVFTPFVDMTKGEVVKLGERLGVPFKKTWSCYNPTDENEPCGWCGACIERSKVL
jgi:7-cyano-7-deazaguanine synthase